MALELIVNVLLFVGAFFCYWYVGATVPVSPENELGAEQWPQLLLGLLIVSIAFNLYHYFKTNKKEDIQAAFADFIPGAGRFLRSKLMIGMVLVLTMSYFFDILGFLATSLLLMVSYGLLLGAHRPVTLVALSALITVVLYIGFSVFLGVMLPRGDVPFLRNFALFVESLVGI
jgi:hypothetical protein